MATPYDEQRGVRLKAVELVIEEKPWTSMPYMRKFGKLPISAISDLYR